MEWEGELILEPAFAAPGEGVNGDYMHDAVDGLLGTDERYESFIVSLHESLDNWLSVYHIRLTPAEVETCVKAALLRLAEPLPERLVEYCCPECGQVERWPSLRYDPVFCSNCHELHGLDTIMARVEPARPRRFAGADWIKENVAPEISAFGEQVADLLGDVFCGIYHLDPGALNRARWSNDRYIWLIVDERLSTFDNDSLTRLVVLCHERAIRCEIEASAWPRLRLNFERRSREGERHKRHPSIEEAALSIRKEFHHAGNRGV